MTTIAGIEQAVIVAGGRGVRLKPLTDTKPKPMILFHGKPFLEYLIENLRDQGILRIVLLLGYLHEVIQEYFQDGKKWNVSISYSVTDIDDETGKRMKSAEHLFDQRFLFLYADNYWPLQLDKMVTQFNTAGTLGQLTVYRNADAYTRPNVIVDDSNLIIMYDKARTALNLKMVDIGFALFKKEIMNIIPSGENVSFEASIYPSLIKQYQLGAFITDHRYYTLTSPERLPRIEIFFKREPFIILDRDGVLNKKPPRAQYVTKWEDFVWLPGAKKAVKLLKENGFKIIIITNQAGIARGNMSQADFIKINDRMKVDLSKAGGSIDGIYYCPHNWDEGCECRKPKPGMLFSAQKDFNLDLSRVFFIGDDERDLQAGNAAGCKVLLVSNKTSLLTLIKEKILPAKNHDSQLKGSHMWH
ncbi:MAG: HAD-IIIA family hydrolase [bacterium]